MLNYFVWLNDGVNKLITKLQKYNLNLIIEFFLSTRSFLPLFDLDLSSTFHNLTAIYAHSVF